MASIETQIRLGHGVRDRLLDCERAVADLQATARTSDEAQAVYEATAYSWRRALTDLLTGAQEIWLDGADLSFGGVMGPIEFGLIAWKRPDGSIQWTFHS